MKIYAPIVALVWCGHSLKFNSESDLACEPTQRTDELILACARHQSRLDVVGCITDPGCVWNKVIEGSCKARAGSEWYAPKCTLYAADEPTVEGVMGCYQDRRCKWITWEGQTGEHTTTNLPQAVSWMVATGRSNCDVVCATAEKTCDIDSLELTMSNEALIKQVYQQIGYNCLNYDRACDDDDSCVMSGAPYLDSSTISGDPAESASATCSFGSKVAPCTKMPAQSEHLRLCACQALPCEFQLMSKIDPGFVPNGGGKDDRFNWCHTSFVQACQPDWSTTPCESDDDCRMKALEVCADKNECASVTLDDFGYNLRLDEGKRYSLSEATTYVKGQCRLSTGDISLHVRSDSKSSDSERGQLFGRGAIPSA